MLSSERVKPFLCHGERIVREYAARYFARSFSRDPDLIYRVLESCDRYGEEENSLLLGYATDFVQSEMSLHMVLERLPRATDINVIFHYNTMISGADVSLLNAVLPKVMKTRNVYAETVDRIERRLVLASCTTEQLWERLFSYCDEIAPRSFNQVDFGFGLDIVEALAKRCDLPVEEIKSCLRDDETCHRYDELYLVILAGEARFGRAIPELIGKLRIDADMLCDHAGESLVRIGTEEVIAQLKECFPKESRHFRNISAPIFGDIKIPASEKALLEIFPGEDDPGIRTFLALDFCELISEKGVPLVRRLIEEGNYDRMAVDLEKPLYAACRILGMEWGEMER